MLKTYVSRVAAGAVISAALMAGSLSLTTTAASACSGSPKCNGGPPPAAVPASACTDPHCVKGVPPVTASSVECTDPKCVSGTPPAGGVSTAGSVASAHADARTAINCPPSIAVAMASSGGGPGC
jgi:hypothetical protein